jgi:hypothetical protein
VQLALDDQRIDLAGSVDRPVADDGAAAGLGIDLDFAQVGAVAETQVRRIVSDGGFKPELDRFQR